MKTINNNTLHTFILGILMLLPIAAMADNKTLSDGASIDKINDNANIEVTFNLVDLDVDSRQAVILTPWLIGEGDSLELPSVGIYGKNRYYYYNRQGQYGITGSSEITFRTKDVPSSYSYETSTSWKEWMNHCSLYIKKQVYGCCSTITEEDAWTAASYDEVVYVPEYIYVRPEAERIKNRSISGQAYLIFKVGKAAIDPSLYTNKTELEKIKNSVESIKDDNDTEITTMSIVGYASPEGKYSTNSNLASSRTLSLKKYIVSEYGVGEDMISADYVPENWQGLKEYVEASELSNKDAILEIIDSNAEPDAKEEKIRSTYPDDYAILLKDCYPSLRRTDYKVEYTVKQYTDTKEILQLVKTSPQKLSLEEFYLAAQELEPGSDEYNEVFDVAVTMFPDDETANLNAANSAMQRGDYVSAKKYLDRAGETSEAAHAREIYANLTQQK